MTWATAPLSRSGHEGESWSRNSLRLLTRPTVRLGLHNTQNKGAREALLSTPQLGQLRLRELDNLPKLRGSKARPRGLKPSRLEAGNSLLSGWALHVKGCVLLSGRGWAVGVSKGRTGALMEASWRWQRSAPPPQVHTSPTLLHTHGGLSPVLGCVHAGAGSRLPRILGKPDCGAWMPVLLGFPLTLTGLELQGSHQSRKTNSFTQVKERQLLLILCCSWQGVVNGAAPRGLWGRGSGSALTWPLCRARAL